MLKNIFLVGLLSLVAAAQQPAEVPVAKEPHHHLVFENEYVRVFKVEVPPHEATLVHRHTRDYVVVTLGDAEVTNAVVGKEPQRWSFTDGDVRLLEASGDKSFAHKAANEGEKPFVNYTVELLKPTESNSNADDFVGHRLGGSFRGRTFRGYSVIESSAVPVSIPEWNRSGQMRKGCESLSPNSYVIVISEVRAEKTSYRSGEGWFNRKKTSACAIGKKGWRIVQIGPN